MRGCGLPEELALRPVSGVKYSLLKRRIPGQVKPTDIARKIVRFDGGAQSLLGSCPGAGGSGSCAEVFTARSVGGTKPRTDASEKEEL